MSKNENTEETVKCSLIDKSVSLPLVESIRWAAAGVSNTYWRPKYNQIEISKDSDTEYCLKSTKG